MKNAVTFLASAPVIIPIFQNNLLGGMLFIVLVVVLLR
jgi:hypothetical protein